MPGEKSGLTSDSCFFIRAMCLRQTLLWTVKCLLHNKQKCSLSPEFALYSLWFQVFESEYRVNRRILEALNGVYWNTAILFPKGQEKRLNGKTRNEKKNDHCKKASRRKMLGSEVKRPLPYLEQWGPIWSSTILPRAVCSCHFWEQKLWKAHIPSQLPPSSSPPHERQITFLYCCF